MTKIAYEEWNPNAATLVDLARAETIIDSYRARGYSMTLRQLYYQFVSRDFIPNTNKSYKRLGSIVNRGRLAGLLDWDMIEDRTRNLKTLSHWSTPGKVIAAAANGYQNDLWRDQDFRVEVWVEKEALAGVVQRTAERWDCPWFSCRGYVSQSELWGAGQRIGKYVEKGQRVVILHLGDHDPSGIDMTRDIGDRMKTFVLGDAAERLGWGQPLKWKDPQFGTEVDNTQDVMFELLEQFGNDEIQDFDELVEVRRIALNMDQVRQWNPPPNPAKMTDSRSGDYVQNYGRQSWELDALPPDTLNTLIEDNILSILDIERFNARYQDQENDRELLRAASSAWPAIAARLGAPDTERED